MRAAWLICLVVGLALITVDAGLLDEDGLDLAMLEVDETIETHGGEADGIDSGSDSDDGVDNIIDSLVNDVKTGNMKALGGATATVLANSNVLNHKEANRNSNFEEKLKKTKEEDRKTRREDFKKQRMEEGQKRLEDKSKKRVASQKKKLRGEQLKLENEQDKKQAAEEKAKTAEAKSKRTFEKKTKATVKTARKKAAEGEAKARKQLAKEKKDEEKKKGALEKKNKAAIKEIKAKAKAKRVAAERDAKAKHKREKQRKEREQKHERAQKAALQRQEARKKKQEAEAAGKSRDCRAVRVYFNRNHQWHQCPSGYLVNGMYRNRGHYLNNIYYLSCCRPSGMRGRKVLEVTACQTANWARSFDRRGWSYCPKNTYIQGFYKSSCNWIYCLEYAKCCAIAGSRGYKGCGNSRWFAGNRAGWVKTPANTFLRGLYRSNDQRIFSIYHGSQCGFYAFP